MTKLKLGLAVAAISVAGFACGGDNTENNGGTTNGATNNADNNTNGTPNNNTNGTPNNNTNASTNGTPNNNTNGMTNNNTNNNNTNSGTNNVPEPPPDCSSDTPPPRCSEDPTGFEYGDASVINDFFIEGTEDEPVCCFDYDGEPPGIDNALGTNLASFGFLGDINTTIEDSIAGGSLVLVLEHDGLDALDNDDAFTVNFFIGQHDYADIGAVCADPGECDTGVCNIPAGEAMGECGVNFDPAGSNPVLLDPASFDMGAQPQAYLPDASVTGSAAVAGPGTVKIEVALFDSPLQLTISLARIEADVDAGNSALGDGTGVALTSGKLGGVVKVEDIFRAVNEFAATCDCLGLNGEDLVEVSSGSCSENADQAACEDAGEGTCAEVAGSCNLLGAVALFADVDLDGDGLNDSVSIGSTFSAVGANIGGVAQ